MPQRGTLTPSIRPKPRESNFARIFSMTLRIDGQSPICPICEERTTSKGCCTTADIKHPMEPGIRAPTGKNPILSSFTLSGVASTTAKLKADPIPREMQARVLPVHSPIRPSQLYIRLTNGHPFSASAFSPFSVNEAVCAMISMRDKGAVTVLPVDPARNPLMHGPPRERYGLRVCSRPLGDGQTALRPLATGLSTIFYA
mmetsp:Transcript_47309/g.86894  ORF Transcript_47309/g.86894 Transcript_47309/m.86894 type:complete len:200 (-) Transcript_47309:28-627(-)